VKVLIVAAHPDDEALGCGGTIARHVERGDVVDVLFVADGVSARGADAQALARRQDAARKATSILGTQPPHFLDLPDNQLDSVPLIEVTQAIERLAREVAPAIVYTHHGADLNVDHRIVHQAVLTAFRPIPGASVVGLFAFETASSTEWSSSAVGPAFAPDRFVDISGHLECKVAALDAYAEEMRPFPHARSLVSVRSLAMWRGACVGLAAAEAFVTLRWIER